MSLKKWVLMYRVEKPQGQKQSVWVYEPAVPEELVPMAGIEWSDELDRLYAVLLDQLPKWHPGKYAEDSLAGYKDHKFGSLSMKHLMSDAGERCKFAQRVQLLKRLRAEGRVPGVEEEST